MCCRDAFPIRQYISDWPITRDPVEPGSQSVYKRQKLEPSQGPEAPSPRPELAGDTPVADPGTALQQWDLPPGNKVASNQALLSQAQSYDSASQVRAQVQAQDPMDYLLYRDPSVPAVQGSLVKNLSDMSSDGTVDYRLFQEPSRPNPSVLVPPLPNINWDGTNAAQFCPGGNQMGFNSQGQFVQQPTVAGGVPQEAPVMNYEAGYNAQQFGQATMTGSGNSNTAYGYGYNGFGYYSYSNYAQVSGSFYLLP